MSNYLTVSFKGICSHVLSVPGVASRVILPKDLHGTHSHDRHIPYVEVNVRDLVSVSPLEPSIRYVRDQVLYQRFELNGEIVSIPNTDAGFGPVIDDAIKKRLPSLTAISKDVSPTPRPECLGNAPVASIISGWFDMKAGVLTPGENAAYATLFEPPNSPPVPAAVLAQSTELLLKLNVAQPVIEITGGSGATRRITLKEGTTTITIGNQLEAHIRGLSEPADRPEKHFVLYYDLSATVVGVKPLPVLALGIVNLCSNTTYP